MKIAKTIQEMLELVQNKVKRFFMAHGVFSKNCRLQ